MIKLASSNQIEEIIECLNESRLKIAYFNDKNSTQQFFNDSINKQELFVYIDNDGKIKGFIRVDLKGMFSRFPLLRTIAVHPSCRNVGIGKTLLEYFEEISTGNSNKVFLCVSDFNDHAKKLYISLGYEEVGLIRSLYKIDIDEYIMMKSI